MHRVLHQYSSTVCKHQQQENVHMCRYYRNSEWMHIVLNITKTVWAVCFGVPRQSPFWTPGRRLAIAWKFGIDSLMVSGLGELVSPSH